MTQFSASTHTLEHLDWDWIKTRLKQSVKTPPAADLCEDLPWTSSQQEAERLLAEVEEAMGLLSMEATFPIGETPDIRPHLLRVHKDAVLEGTEILELIAVIEYGQLLRRFLHIHKDKAPALFVHAEATPDLGHLIHTIKNCFNPDGELRDSASPDLGELRNNAQRLHRQILKRMSSYLSSDSMRDLLQDQYYTVKEDRYVLPIKSYARTSVDGIVLGSSASGATLFIEPREIVDLNNSHKLALLEVQKEVQRILRSFCDQLRTHEGAIQESLGLLTSIDVIHAKAKVCLQLKANVPTFNSEGRIRLVQAKHPILILTREKVVPNDIQIGPHFNTLILTGPNTGGKTVILKTVGICALMTRAGIPIPAEKGSTLPFFDHVFADIGDDQSLEANQSTFSSHIVRISEILNSLKGQDLILLDEVVIGTDPEEGAALAQALLEYLSGAGAITLATTHYLALKGLASLHPNFENASLGFDPVNLAPSYQLLLGIPGSSNALEIARRLGLPDRIIQKAETFLGTPRSELDQLLIRINRLKQDLEVGRSTLALLTKENEALKESLHNRLSEITARERALKGTYRQKLEKEFSGARLALQEWRHKLKATTTSKSLRVIQQDLSELRDQTLSKEGIFAHEEETESPGGQVDWSIMHCGDWVYLRTLNTEAKILKMPDRKGNVLVEAGGFRMQAKAEDISPLSISRLTIRTRDKEKPTSSFSLQEDSTSRNLAEERSTCDLRGLTVEEALAELVHCIDKGFIKNVPRIYLIHGLGTGALKKAVRDYLEQSPYSLSFRPGKTGEGGDGVTVVEFEDPSSLEG